MLNLQQTAVYEGYSEEDVPVAGYAVLVAAFHALLFALHRLSRGRGLPEGMKPGDFAVLTLATHKLSRIVTKDWVTIPLRAPFTRYESSPGGGEVRERARGHGLRRAIGDLLTCNYCIGPWIAGILTFGFVARPRTVRLLATIFSLVAVSDFLHFAFQILRAENTRIAREASPNGTGGDRGSSSA